jgi:radical SAM-linked protein
VQRIRIRYAKRGRMRFSSHRDFARAFERALRRAEVPMAYSAGFHPHPKISSVGAAPTGVASEAEYLEIALAEHREPEQIRAAIDEVLPEGLDIVAAVDAAGCGPGSLAERIEASLWRLEFAPGDPATAGLGAAVETLMSSDSVLVERLTKDGRRSLDARAPIVAATVSASGAPPAVSAGGANGLVLTRAILELVVRQVTPTVRPDDVLTALLSVAGFAPPQAPRATRLAQGPIDQAGVVGDPLGSNELATAE